MLYIQAKLCPSPGRVTCGSVMLSYVYAVPRQTGLVPCCCLTKIAEPHLEVPPLKKTPFGSSVVIPTVGSAYFRTWLLLLYTRTGMDGTPSKPRSLSVN